MWLLAIPLAAIIGAWLYGASQTSSKNTPISQLPEGPVPPNALPQGKAIVAGDLIDVDIFTGKVVIPNKPTGKVVMRVLSLDVPGDAMKQNLIANFVFPTDLVTMAPQIVNRQGVTPAEITLGSTSGIVSPATGVSPAAQQASAAITARNSSPEESATLLAAAGLLPGTLPAPAGAFTPEEQAALAGLGAFVSPPSP